MILITVELLSARTHKRTPLGAAIISNDGDHPDPAKGNYTIRVAHKSDVTSGLASIERILGKPLRTAQVRDFPRLSYNMWRLVLRALRGAFPEES